MARDPRTISDLYGFPRRYRNGRLDRRICDCGRCRQHLEHLADQRIYHCAQRGILLSDFPHRRCWRSRPRPAHHSSGSPLFCGSRNHPVSGSGTDLSPAPNLARRRSRGRPSGSALYADHRLWADCTGDVRDDLRSLPFCRKHTDSTDRQPDGKRLQHHRKLFPDLSNSDNHDWRNFVFDLGSRSRCRRRRNFDRTLPVSASADPSRLSDIWKDTDSAKSSSRRLSRGTADPRPALADQRARTP